MKIKNNDSLMEYNIKSLMVPLMLVLFISTLDQTIVVTALDRIGQTLGNAAAAPWIATAYLLTSAVTTLIFGKLGDMYGRKSVLQISIAIFIIGSALCAFAPDMFWLIAFRAFQGIGGGGLSSLVMAIVGDLVPPRQRARYQAILGIVPAIALLAGPVLGGLIVDSLSWPFIFMINVPIGIAAFVIIAKKLHLPVRKSKHRVDIAGGILAVIFTTSFLLLTVFGGHDYRWGSWQIISLGILGITSLGLYILVESKVAEPITPLRLFRNSVFSISSTLFFLSTAILFVGMLFVPLMLQTVFGLSAFLAGACIVPLLFGLIAATMMTGNSIAKTGRYKKFPVIGSFLCGGALLALSLIPDHSPVWLIILALTILGAGVGFFIQVTVLAGQNAVSTKDLGVATGALNFFKNLGGAAGSAVFGAVLNSAMQKYGHQPMSPYHLLFMAAIPLAFIALMLALAMQEKPLSETAMEIAEGKIEAPEY